ncbi:MAG: methyltransferase [bacterium]|nr:methyltransferase [bacterium]
MKHYFTNEETKDSPQIINYTYKDMSFRFKTNAGVFSKNKLDYGSIALLNSIDIKSLEGRVLDLGCGYGTIGIIMGKINSNLLIDMVDINKKAVNLSKENAAINKVRNTIIYESDIFSNVKHKYNSIVTNPPIRAGKDIVLKFLKGASDYLLSEGVLWFVIRKDQGAKTIVKELESVYDIRNIGKSKGFYIFLAKKLKKVKNSIDI